MMAEMSRLTFGELVGNFCGGATAVWTLRTATFGILQILFRFCWTCSHPAQANRQKKEPPRRKITELLQIICQPHLKRRGRTSRHLQTSSPASGCEDVDPMTSPPRTLAILLLACALAGTASAAPTGSFEESASAASDEIRAHTMKLSVALRSSLTPELRSALVERFAPGRPEPSIRGRSLAVENICTWEQGGEDYDYAYACGLKHAGSHTGPRRGVQLAQRGCPESGCRRDGVHVRLVGRLAPAAALRSVPSAAEAGDDLH